MNTRVGLTARSAKVGLSPARNVRAVWTTIASVFRYRELLREMVGRELSAAHALHGFGWVWIYVHPLVMVATYLLIFGFVLGTKIAVSGEFPGDYPGYILAGLVPWLIMQAAIVKAPSALITNANLVKQVVFPIEVLPITTTIAATIPHLPALVLVILYKLFVGGLSSTFLLFPLVVVLHLFIALG